MLTDKEAEVALNSIVSELGKFEAHNIQLSENVFTIGKDSIGGNGRHGRFVALATSLYGEDLSGLRVLDLACLEGKTAIEFAKRGATSVGVEIRDHHLDKARGVAKALGLSNASFVTDDIRNVSPEKYGMFDIVICSGILYHLDQPDVFETVKNISRCCSKLIIIDTSTSLVARKKVQWGGNEYSGRFAVEHNPGDDENTKLERTWASIDNEKSFYLTKASLINLMTVSGASCVSQLHMPFKYAEGHPRVTYFGFMTKADTSLAGDRPFSETPFVARSMNKRVGPKAVDPMTARVLLRAANKTVRVKKATNEK